AFTLDVIQSLRAHSLLTMDPSTCATHEVRYSMYQSVRDYAARRLGELEDGDSIRERHARYFAAIEPEAEYVRTVARGGPDLGRLVAERDNFGTAFAWAASRSLASPEHAKLA